MQLLHVRIYIHIWITYNLEDAQMNKEMYFIFGSFSEFIFSNNNYQTHIEWLRLYVKRSENRKVTTSSQKLLRASNSHACPPNLYKCMWHIFVNTHYHFLSPYFFHTQAHEQSSAHITYKHMNNLLPILHTSTWTIS